MASTAYAQADSLRARVEQISHPAKSPAPVGSLISEDTKAQLDEILSCLSGIDGSESWLVSLVTGLSQQRLDELGGI